VSGDLFIDMQGSESILGTWVTNTAGVRRMNTLSRYECSYQYMPYKNGDLYNEQSGGLPPYSTIEKIEYGFKCTSSLIGKSYNALIAASDKMDKQMLNQEIEIKNQPISNSYVRDAWVKNVVYLGKSMCDVMIQDGMEYALLLVGLRQLLYKFPDASIDPSLVKSYNDSMGDVIESIVDFTCLIPYLEQKYNSEYLDNSTDARFPESLIHTLDKINNYWDFEQMQGLYSIYDYACILSSFGLLPEKSLPVVNFYEFEQSKRRFQAIAHRGEQASKALPGQTEYFHQLQKIKSFQNEKF
jgi:hypothetical protein